MADNGTAKMMPSNLLALPRELRNNIYQHLGKDMVLGGDMKLENHLCATKLFHGPNTALLQVCKQIHDEYEEVAFDRTSALFLRRTFYDTCSIPASLDTGVPLEILRSVKSFKFGSLLGPAIEHMDTKEKRQAFSRAMRQDEEVLSSLTWTPTKDLVEGITKGLCEMRLYVAQDATVEVMLHFHMADERQVARMLTNKIFQPEILFAMECDKSLPFAENGKLKVAIRIGTPLFQAYETFPDDGAASTSEQRSGGKRIIDSSARVLWSLRPFDRGGEQSSHYLGFYPEFLRLM